MNETVIEIFAEAALSDLLFQIAIGGRYSPLSTKNIGD
jgi:hypothetical protein